jgi:hypothetical protein
MPPEMPWPTTPKEHAELNTYCEERGILRDGPQPPLGWAEYHLRVHYGGNCCGLCGGTSTLRFCSDDPTLVPLNAKPKAVLASLVDKNGPPGVTVRCRECMFKERQAKRAAPFKAKAEAKAQAAQARAEAKAQATQAKSEARAAAAQAKSEIAIAKLEAKLAAIKAASKVHHV